MSVTALNFTAAFGGLYQNVGFISCDDSVHTDCKEQDVTGEFSLDKVSFHK